jgi:hypothetical protein
MLNFGQLTSAVQVNCDISDARYAGNYSLCTFLLKMRELYRWEHDLPLSAPLARDAVGRWLSEREQHWDTLDGAELRALAIDDATFDPFDSSAINARLTPHGRIYSAGRGLFGKPQFVLGELKRSFVDDNVTFHVSGREFAREISASPAMALGETVFIRQESLRRFLWEKIEEWRWKKNDSAPLARALACYANPDDLDATLEQMTENETATLVYHELGEVRVSRVVGTRWHDMLNALTRAKVEFLARAARDNLADCMVTLPNLLAQRNDAALHFYFANFTGLRREIFPDAQNAYLRWIGGGSTRALAELCERGVAHWSDAVARMVDRYAAAPETIDADIEAQFAAAPGDTVSCSR